MDANPVRAGTPKQHRGVRSISKRRTALALGLRHPHAYGVILAASPGAGYRPPDSLPTPLPRTYLVAGKQEPFFLDNAARWATALHDAGADVVLTERTGSHGDPFWQDELPLMVAWAFNQ